MNILNTSQSDFLQRFDELLGRGGMDMSSVTPRVLSILDDIKIKGDDAIFSHVSNFDGWTPKKSSDLIIEKSEMLSAYEKLDQKMKDSLKLAKDRIWKYHERQMPHSWMEYEDNGSVVGVKVTPVDSVGLYIPGGKAAYPSSLLMNAIPAMVAGVKEIVVCTPAPNNELNTLLLAAMHFLGIEKAYKVGGASAIGAMAYGTISIPKVDVITGPGNIYVATAKKLVYGDVNIDMIAGPSEIGVIADFSADPKYVAMDLLSQAEHDQMASSILITPSEKLAFATKDEVYNFLPTLKRESIARESIEKRGAIIITKDINEAIELMNKIAPEHLELMCENPFELLPKIKHAGAIFMGKYTPEAIGDYIAGPNHTLPTGGTARFYSPLSVENFIKRSSIISMSENGINSIGEFCASIANAEGLGAHEESVLIRLKDLNK